MNSVNDIRDIATVEWAECEWIGLGGYAVVYRVAPGVAAKVGRIEPEEVEAQRHFARQGLALPVWDYRASWQVPERIDREVCPVHGLRREILPPAAGNFCTCGSLEHAVLLMPEADDDPIDTRSTVYRAFLLGFLRDCELQLGRIWDARPANVARYRGRLVALDFGEES
jgi:hypothetical protein